MFSRRRRSKSAPVGRSGNHNTSRRHAKRSPGRSASSLASPAERLEERLLLSASGLLEIGRSSFFIGGVLPAQESSSASTPPPVPCCCACCGGYLHYDSPQFAGEATQLSVSGELGTPQPSPSPTPALETAAEAEPNDGTGTATAVTLATGSILTAADQDWLTISGSITAGDLDYYRFSVTTASGVFFDIDSRDTGLSTTLDSVVDVYNSSGTLVTGGSNNDGYDFQGFAAPTGGGTSNGTSRDSSLYLDLSAGDYYVRVSGNSSSTGDYQLRMLADNNYSSNVPVLNSSSGAADTLFLDFDGHIGNDFWGSYTARAFDFNGNDPVFTPG